DPPVAGALAVTLAMIGMMVTRALHPPGGAVALLIALNAKPGTVAGFDFALMPVLVETILLVMAALLFNRLTGRKYPFRQPPETGSHGTRDPSPERRLGLSADDLGQILQKMNLAANIGTEDLARLIGAAEAEATARHLGGLAAQDVMSQDQVTVAPDSPPEALVRIFQNRQFKTLPVVAGDGTYLGLLSQADLLAHRDRHDAAEQMMSTDFATARPDMPLAPLLALLADGGQQAVPVLEGQRLVGLVTRSDMIGALAPALRS
ncbi:MAG: CBS domain-containing protein, partial [Rhodobacteraceae bacterium]|nr:CBS domain-containing protein [Paracoccaceae bacterium]